MLYKEFAPAPIYYFSYGMLTDPANMANAELIGAAELRNFKFEMMLYANVVYEQGQKVLGTLWNVERSLLGTLDKVEECPWLYNRKMVPVFCNGKRYEAEVYSMTPDAREHHYGTLPKKEYVQSLVNGYRNAGLPLQQISDALRAIPSIYNNDPSRRTINEVNMSPSSLKKFIQTANGRNVMVGFEAEMLVPNLENFDEERERIEDYARSMPIPADRNAIKQIAQWFDAGDNPPDPEYLAQKLRRYQSDFNEFTEEKFNDYTNTRAGQETLYKVIKADRLSAGSSATDDEIKTDISEENGWYDDANFKIQNHFERSTNYWPEFLESQHMETMRDFCVFYDLDWPYFKETYVGTLTIEELQQDFSNYTGFQGKASRQYHTITRGPDVWIFEPDASLSDRTNTRSGVELISPPIPLAEIFKNLDIFWNWAGSNDITANASCGFHVGVSLTDQMTYKIDKLKLLAFLGDGYILKTFGRMNSAYAKNTFDYMKAGLEGADLNRTIPILKSGLEKIANSVFLQTFTSGDTRHYSINVKPHYIEFRQAGGNYFEKKSEIVNTIMRYVKAMVIAADPQAEKKEYAKKLYKLLTQNTTVDNETTNIFARYVAGEISLDEMKDTVYTIRYNRNNN